MHSLKQPSKVTAMNSRVCLGSWGFRVSLAGEFGLSWRCVLMDGDGYLGTADSVFVL